MDLKTVLMIVWTIFFLAFGVYLNTMFKALAGELEKTNLLLTVIANKQGATEDDVRAALKK
ncbi:MAG: hypothetical protein RDV48_16900 [Candidatus Eremiobacteraeota bacterium]|nr:hypothetical protein [Candidatus Eremiobacteraeota bacterium]